MSPGSTPGFPAEGPPPQPGHWLRPLPLGLTASGQSLPGQFTLWSALSWVTPPLRAELIGLMRSPDPAAANQQAEPRGAQSPPLPPPHSLFGNALRFAGRGGQRWSWGDGRRGAPEGVWGGEGVAAHDKPKWRGSRSAGDVEATTQRKDAESTESGTNRSPEGRGAGSSRIGEPSLPGVTFVAESLGRNSGC